MQLTRILYSSIGTLTVPGIFIQHFNDIDNAIILSEIIRLSEESEKEGEGWFPKTYECWSRETGINATKVREVCLALVEKRLIDLELRRVGRHWVTHFKFLRSNIEVLFKLSKPRKEYIGSCPVCGGRVLEGEKSFYCSKQMNGKYCSFRLRKTELARWGLNTLPVGVVRKLLLDGIAEVKNLKGKKGRPFNCFLKIEQREQGAFVRLDFGQKREQGELDVAE